MWRHFCYIDFKLTSSGCHSFKVLGTTVGYSLFAMVTGLWCHLTYNLRGAWHTLYAMLLSNYMGDATEIYTVEKFFFSQITDSFSNNLIFCYLWDTKGLD